MIWLHLAKPPVCAGTDVCTCMCAHKQRHEHGAQGVQEMSVCFQLWIRRQFSKLSEDVLSCVSHFSLPTTLSGNEESWRLPVEHMPITNVVSLLGADVGVLGFRL